MSSQQQKALVLESKCGPLVLQDVDVPKPGPGEVLVRVGAAALNSADSTIRKLGVLIGKYPCILGFNAAGTVVEVGPSVTAYGINDRILFQGWFDFVNQSLHSGAFQQYTTVLVECAAKIPPNISFEAAATVPSGVTTAAFPLYNQAADASSVKLLPPWETSGRAAYAGKPIFILGGASSVGQYAIQFARLSGFSPIVTTASLHNAPLLQSLGATHVLDRALPAEALSEQARAIAGGPFGVVYDAISVPETLAAAYSATAPGGDLVIVTPQPVPGADKGEDEDGAQKKKVHLARGMIKMPVNQGIAQSLLAALPALLESGDIKPVRAEVLGDLRAVEEGLERLHKGQVSAAKLVVKPQETK